MPVRVRPRGKGEGGKAWKIVEDSGKVVAESNTEAKAVSSMRKRNAAFFKKAKGVR